MRLVTKKLLKSANIRGGFTVACAPKDQTLAMPALRSTFIRVLEFVCPTDEYVLGTLVRTEFDRVGWKTGVNLAHECQCEEERVITREVDASVLDYYGLCSKSRSFKTSPGRNGTILNYLCDTAC
jgi:hypothetical protein